MQGNLTIPKIKQKFKDLKQLDEQYKRTHTEQKKHFNFQEAVMMIGQVKMKQQQIQKQNKVKKVIQRQTEIIYTKSDICQQISKLKPYLDKNLGIALEDLTEDSESKEKQDYQQLQYKELCKLIIFYNRKLCEKLSEAARLEDQLNRHDKQSEGWVFQVQYKWTQSSMNELQFVNVNNGYAVLTEIVEIFESLTFERPLVSISMNNVSWIKYNQDSTHDIIQIKHSEGTIQIGFINNAEFKLFDRMLFLQKNMARSSSTRLFQSQLLKSIYQEF